MTRSDRVGRALLCAAGRPWRRPRRSFRKAGTPWKGVGEAGRGALKTYQLTQNHMLRTARENPSSSNRVTSPSMIPSGIVLEEAAFLKSW
jgi:hypothetical protein